MIPTGAGVLTSAPFLFFIKEPSFVLGIVDRTGVGRVLGNYSGLGAYSDIANPLSLCRKALVTGKPIIMWSNVAGLCHSLQLPV